MAHDTFNLDVALFHHHGYWTYEPVRTIMRTSCTYHLSPYNSLYPIAPLALELPQYVQSKYLLLISTGSWFIVPLRQVLKKPLFFELYVPLSVASLYLIRRLKRPGLPDLGTKLGVNLLYFAALLHPANSSGLIYWLSAPYITMGPAVPLICMRLSFVVAGFMFGIAAVLYGIAIARRHPLVSSSLLGGTGVEAMVLTLPSSGPSHQSVGDEAGDGAIRL